MPPLKARPFVRNGTRTEYRNKSDLRQRPAGDYINSQEFITKGLCKDGKKCYTPPYRENNNFAQVASRRFYICLQLVSFKPADHRTHAAILECRQARALYLLCRSCLLGGVRLRNKTAALQAHTAAPCHSQRIRRYRRTAPELYAWPQLLTVRLDGGHNRRVARQPGLSCRCLFLPKENTRKG